MEGTAELIAELLSYADATALEWCTAVTHSSPPEASGPFVAWMDNPEPSVRDQAEIEKKFALADRRFEFLLARGTASSSTWWLERLVKPEAFSALRRAVDALPSTDDRDAQIEAIVEASAFTNDPLELVAIVQSVVDDVTEQDGGGAPAYARSLYRAVAERLVARLMRLGGEDRREAVALVLDGGVGDSFRPDFRRGAEAIERIGLGIFRHGDLALGPLARAVAKEGPVRDAFVAKLPQDAWSSRAANATGIASPPELLPKEAARPWPAQTGAGGPSGNASVWAADPADVLVFCAAELDHEAMLMAVGVGPEFAHSVARGDAVPGFPQQMYPPMQTDRKPGGGSPYRIRVLRMDVHGGFISGPATRAFVREANPRLVAACGRCTGVPGKTEVGDVVIADRVIRYDLVGADVTTASVNARITYRLNSHWDKRIEAWLRESRPGQAPVHVGPIATGSRLFREPSLRQHRAIAERVLLGFEVEMEAIDAVAEESNALIVCGVSDLMNAETRTASRGEDAARAAATWLVRFLDAEFQNL